MLSVCLLAALTASAQGGLSVKTQISTGHGRLPKAKPISVIGTNDDYAYFWENQTKKGEFLRTLFAVSNDLSEQRELALPMEYEGNEMDMQRVVLSTDKQRLHLLTSFNNRQSDVTSLLVTDIDALTLTTGEPRVVLQLPGAAGKNRDYWTITQTESSGRLAVNAYARTKTEALDVLIAVLNPDMSVASKHVHTAASKDEAEDVKVLAVADDGTLYYITSVGKPDRRRQISEKSFVLHAIRPSGEHIEQPLSVSGYTVVDQPESLLKHDGSLVLFGRLYNEDEDEFVGFYYHTYDSDLHTLAAEYGMATETEGGLVSTGNTRTKLSKDGQKFMESFGEAKLVEAQGGGVYAIGTSTSYRSVRTTTYKYDDQWTYHDLLISYLSPAGDLVWSKPLPYLAKHDTEAIDYFPYTGGFGAATLGDRLMLTYFDDARNASNSTNKPNYSTVALWKKQGIRHALFSPDGNYQVGKDRRFFETKSLLLFPRLLTRAPQGDGLIYFGFQERDFNFVKVSPITK